MTPSLQNSHLRIARATNRLSKIVLFYTRRSLDFQLLGQFEGHSGFDGVMLGHEGLGYHLEFTSHDDSLPRPPPDQDDLLVFYVPDADAWLEITTAIEQQGHKAVPSNNPYWDRNGRTYLDPDGFRVVIQNATWPPE